MNMLLRKQQVNKMVLVFGHFQKNLRGMAFFQA